MKVIREKLIDAVQDETGIKLTSNDFKITAESGTLGVSLWDSELLELPYEEEDLNDEDFAEEVVQELFKEHFDLREKIIELKLDDLNSVHLPNISDVIIEKLEKHKVDEKILDVLDFEFVDLGYNNGNFTTPGDEEWNYPPMALRVTDFEDLEHYINIDPYKEPSALSYDSICNEIVKKIRGKI